MEEQSTSNTEHHNLPENLVNEERSRFKYKFCRAPFRHVKRFMSSGLLLKGFALAFGLWNPRRRWRAMFALIILLVDVYLSIQTAIYAFVCPTLRAQKTLVAWFCANSSVNITSKGVEGTDIVSSVRMKELLINDAVLDIGRALSHWTFFRSVWMLSKELNCVKQENTLPLVNPWGWIKLNCVLLFFWCALISGTVLVMFGISSSNYSSFVTHGVYSASLWISLLTCWLFGTLISSMETLVTRCTDDIMTAEHLDDIIKKHQQLCKIIFGTSNAFKLWFIVHWVLYTIACVFWVANIVSYSNLMHSHSQRFSFYEIIVGIYSYVFIYPCLRAAQLTGKCQQMLGNFNLMTEEDWHDNHPFRKRSQLHLFLQYTSYADCGYRVGRYKFGSMAVFFSTLLAIVGFGLKIL